MMHVCNVGSAVGGHAPRFRVDCGYRFPTEDRAGPHDVSVREANGVGCLATEHHVELRDADDEGVVPVGQREVEAIAERLGKCRGELEPAETGTQDHDSSLHGLLSSDCLA
jgi:hypothetical protein